jgi:hypothetical protein
MKIFGFAGYSGSGKTTLIEQLIPLFTSRGLKVSLIKHAHHTFDVDHPTKDSYRHRQAGCSEVLVTSSRRWVLMHELRGAPEPVLSEHIKRISRSTVRKSVNRCCTRMMRISSRLPATSRLIPACRSTTSASRNRSLISSCGTPALPEAAAGAFISATRITEVSLNIRLQCFLFL